MKLTAIIFSLVLTWTGAFAAQQWETYPQIGKLPKPIKSGFASINGAKIWYATYGQGKPVILLHGGLANSNYWSHQVPELVKHHYQVIVMDSRGHGRSTNNLKNIHIF